MPDLVDFQLLTAAAIPEQFLAESRANATAVGYANGWAKGLREVHSLHAGERAQSERRIADVAARHAEALQAATFALHEAAGQIESSSLASYDALSEVILAAAIDIAEALLGCELRDAKTSAHAALSRILSCVPANEPVTVWLSRSDHQALTVTNDYLKYSNPSRQIHLEVDERLESGDATGTSGATFVDAKISDGIARLKEHLKR